MPRTWVFSARKKCSTVGDARKGAGKVWDAEDVARQGGGGCNRRNRWPGAYREGWKALYMPNFGIEQRGGVSLAFVQLSREEIGSPKFLTAGLAIVLSCRALGRCHQYIAPQTVVLYDSSLIKPPAVEDQVVGLQSYETRAPEAFPLDYGIKPELTDTGEGLSGERHAGNSAAELAAGNCTPGHSI